MELSEEQFTRYVEEAIDNIPDMYQEKLDNVRFIVEHQPSGSQRKALGLRPCDALYGLYEGVPLTQRHGAVHSIVPDTITIFMSPMMQHFKDQKALKKQIYKTVWHEVAHFFGLNHERIHAAESSLE
jgi:predicted Zn-dependent protease with MMP-like domain